MFNQMFRNWWMLAVRGVMGIVFGIVALVWPESTKFALVLLFGAFAMADGIFAVVTGIASNGYFDRWWAVVLEGLTGIVVGVLTFFLPNVTALALIYLIAAWAVVTGIFEIVAAIRFRRIIPGEWAMILMGLLSIVLGSTLFVFPAAAEVSLVWLIGIYAIIAGGMQLVLAFRMHGLWNDLKSTGFVHA
jgi:uncharacterized membrane protein HdeD (DUF308 family)